MVLKDNEFEMQHQITYYECDPKGYLTLGMLINLAVFASGSQSEALEIGEAAVKEVGGGWVITSYDIFVDHFPKIGEQVLLGTRATSYNKYFAFREFWVKDLAGNELAHINGVFVFMDMATRKMVRIPDEVIYPYHSAPVKRIPRLHRPDEIQTEEAVTQKQYQVRYFDIDANLHVNNAHYFDWMLDALDADFLKTHTLTKMSIKYEREVRYGDLVTSQVTPAISSDQGQVMTKHQILVNQELHAQANCWWNENA